MWSTDKVKELMGHYFQLRKGLRKEAVKAKEWSREELANRHKNKRLRGEAEMEVDGRSRVEIVEESEAPQVEPPHRRLNKRNGCLQSHNLSQGRERRRDLDWRCSQSQVLCHAKKKQSSKESSAQAAKQVESNQTVPPPATAQSVTRTSRPASSITEYQRDPERPGSESEDSLPPGQEFPGVEALQVLSQVSLDSSVNEDILRISDKHQVRETEMLGKEGGRKEA
ncbi:hypothetical protein WMY93_001660 [Mugilogobius chulae]|uniref:Uncharacterized protein n=1 Tax=Mugilogobius chulae TaxID=88201 RepID=A0AAW0PU04_9GOBI